MGQSRAERELARRSEKPTIAAVRFMEKPWAPPNSLLRVEEIASEIKNWKRISKISDTKEHVYIGSAEDGTCIAVTVMTSPHPTYLTFISNEKQQGTTTFTTAKGTTESEIQERIIGAAVIKILGDSEYTES